MNRIEKFLVVFLLTSAGAHAQLPTEITDETYFQPIRSTNPSIVVDVFPYLYQSDMVSDGYGHHYVTVKNNRVTYYRLNNLGNQVYAAPYEFEVGTGYPAITAFYDPPPSSGKQRQHIVLKNGSNIELYRSTNGGSTWSFVASQPILGTFAGLDAYEDQTGVHITYGSADPNGGVRYHLRRRNPDQWAAEFPVFVTSPTSPNLPSIVASADHVYIHHGGPSGNQRGVWYTPTANPTWSGPYYSGIRRGSGSITMYAPDQIVVFPWDGTQYYIWNEFPLDPGNWGTGFLNSGVEGENVNWKSASDLPPFYVPT